jgi:hypothetical protein
MNTQQMRAVADEIDRRWPDAYIFTTEDKGLTVFTTGDKGVADICTLDGILEIYADSQSRG